VKSVLSALERSLRGITVDNESLALDLIQEIGPGGAFLAIDHTRRHFQDELLIPDLIGRQPS
jgi:trimethylamine--corrinoid protein Co-methyltransferase